MALGIYTITYTVTDSSGNSNSTDLTVSYVEAPSLTVTALGDVVDPFDGQTTLREALAYAATLTGPQTVAFSNSTANGAVNFHDAVPETILLGGTELEIVGNVTVDGPGADLLTVDGNSASRVFRVPGTDPDDEIVIRSLTIRNGSDNDGGGVLLEDGTLTLENCNLVENVAGDSGGGVYVTTGVLNLVDSYVFDNDAGDFGGGFHAQTGTVSIVRSAIVFNRVTTGEGGGLALRFADGFIRDSLVEGNTAADAGGIHLGVGSDIRIFNSTITANAANGGNGGGLTSQGTLEVVQSTITNNSSAQAGGGIHVAGGTTTLGNTLLAGNLGSVVGPDGSGAFTDDGGNLVGIDTGTTGFTVSTLVGTAAAPIDPLLTPRANHGGTTLTHALLPGSPAIDAGLDALALDETGAPLATDQRGAGFDRIVKGLATSTAATVDIGAYELFAAPTFTSGLIKVSVDGDPFDLAAASGASPAGGTFSGTGVAGGLFIPRNLAPGIYGVTYTVQDAFGVSNVAELLVKVEDLPPALEVSPPRPFPDTEIGKRSREQRITIRNRGSAEVKGLRVVLSGSARRDFRVKQPVLKTLAGGQSTFFRATFRPKAEGLRKVRVTVLSDGSPVTVDLQGRGLPKPVIRPPRSINP